MDKGDLPCWVAVQEGRWSKRMDLQDRRVKKPMAGSAGR
jgi:hypothetical protein